MKLQIPPVQETDRVKNKSNSLNNYVNCDGKASESYSSLLPY